MSDTSEEAKSFDEAMDKLLKVPPQIVKNAMEAEKRERADERKTRRQERKEK